MKTMMLVREVAEFLGVSRQAVHDAVRRGAIKIAAVDPDTGWLWLDGRTVEAYKKGRPTK